ncbi:hypothetical protein T492DRAFT_1061037 [Pavlovales sp. CCMP2436]|nr:hypothetical protein T492DRAFT_1061037 [Pavlovales sp. CCMP2436]
MPSSLSSLPHSRSPPLHELLSQLARLRPSPRWWGDPERAGGTTFAVSSHGVNDFHSAEQQPPAGNSPQQQLAALDVPLCAASARVASLANTEQGEWRVFYYLLSATWRRLAVAPHQTSADCWLVVGVRVCDCSSSGFLDRHPGERGPLLLFAGLDATEAFEATGHSFAAPYFSALEVFPRLQLPLSGWPYAIARAWRGAPSAPLRTRRLGAHFNITLSAALPGGKAAGGASAAQQSAGADAVHSASGGAPSSSTCDSGSAATGSELRPGQLAMALAGCARLARAGWACVPHTLGFMAFADDSRGRQLSYHDFLALRAAHR